MADYTGFSSSARLQVGTLDKRHRRKYFLVEKRVPIVLVLGKKPVLHCNCLLLRVCCPASVVNTPTLFKVPLDELGEVRTVAAILGHPRPFICGFSHIMLLD